MLGYVIPVVLILHGNCMTYSSTILPVQQKLGISFSPAGLLTPYHLGASYELRKMGLLTSSTSVSGASGGALAAITSALNIDHNDGLAGCEYIAERCRVEGTRYTLKVALNQVLEDILPSDSAEILNVRDAKCSIAYREIFPRPTSHLVDTFTSKDDLIEILRASCNIPFYFNGNWPCVKVRGAAAVDGFFAVERSRFGCPPTQALRELVICPFMPDSVGLTPEGLAGNTASPVENDIQQDTSVALLDGLNVLQSTQSFELLTPALLSPADWPFSMSDLLQLALGPPSISYPASSSNPTMENGSPAVMSSKAAYQLLFECGVETVKTWANTANLALYKT